MPDLPIETVKARISDAIEIMVKLDSYYTTSEAWMFMTCTQPQLNGETPISAIANGRAGDVFAILERLDSGVYL